MLIQGANNPLTIEFSDVVEDLPTLVVTLWQDRNATMSKLIKTWTKADMMVSGKIAVCGFTEEETKALSPVVHVIEAKGLDDNGVTVFWAAFNIDVLRRRDRVIELTRV